MQKVSPSRILSFLACFVFLAAMLYCSLFLSSYQDKDSAVLNHVTIHYMTQAEEETGSPNMVTAVLADYRGFDTLIETSVIFTAGVVTYILVLNRKKKTDIWGGKE